MIQEIIQGIVGGVLGFSLFVFLALAVYLAYKIVQFVVWILKKVARCGKCFRVIYIGDEKHPLTKNEQDEG